MEQCALANERDIPIIVIPVDKVRFGADNKVRRMNTYIRKHNTFLYNFDEEHVQRAKRSICSTYTLRYIGTHTGTHMYHRPSTCAASQAFHFQCIYRYMTYIHTHT
jgi:hypothetical protein